MRSLPSHSSKSADRGGSTLTEVLVAVLVIGVGLVSVATLFPLSVLRSVQANKITQATVLRYSSEALIDSLDLANAHAFFGPDGRPGQLSVSDDGDGTIDVDFWLPGPDGLPGVAGVDDDGGGTTDDDATELGWPGSDDVPVWDLDEMFGAGSDDIGMVVIDPLGYHLMAQTDGSTGNYAYSPVNWRNYFGGNVNGIRRIDGGHRGNNQNTAILNHFTQVQAERIVTSPDQYSTVLDVPLTNAPTVDDLDLPNNLDANIMNDIVANLQRVPAQIIFFGTETGSPRQVTHTRAILHEDLDGDGNYDTPGEELDGDMNFDQTTGRHVEWSSQNPLPTTFQAERAIIQIQNSDFTWMLTARWSPPTSTDVDVVVFYKRQFDQLDEQVFGAPENNPPATNRVTYNNPTPNPADPNSLWITFPAGNRPPVKKGGFLFDVENGYWYQVTNVPDTKETTTSLVLTVDRPILDRNGNGYITAAFPRGVVDVFGIGKK